MIFFIALIGRFLGWLLIGGVLNFIFKPQEHNNPNPKNYLSWIGAIFGAVIAVLIYKS